MNKKYRLSVLALCLLGLNSAWAQEIRPEAEPPAASAAQEAPAAGTEKPKAAPETAVQPAASANSAANESAQPLVTGLPDFTKIVKATEDSVVNIRTMETLKRRRGFNGMPIDPNNPDDLFRFFFGPDFPGNDPDMQFFFRPRPGGSPQDPRMPRGEREDSPEDQTDGPSVPAGVGSGFIIDKEGYIITNNHVVDGASKMTVTLNNGKEYTAKLIGTDKRTDIALIKIDAPNLKPLKIGSAAHLQKGQWVLAIGSPFDLDSTVTSGIVSAINRDTGDYLPFIQTDVAVNPGNSGGPLINLNGEVVGVNSQIISQSGGFMGISLSIPIDDAMQVVQQLKAHGKVDRGQIGVMIAPVDPEVAEALKLPDDQGALVSKVQPGSPAERAGIHPGDLIVEFNGTKINKFSDLSRLVGQYPPNQEAPIKVWRRGEILPLKVLVENLNADKDNAAAKGSAEATGKTDRLGIVPQGLNGRNSKGVKVASAEGAAADAGIRRGDIILAVNNREVVDLSSYQKAVQALKQDSKAVLLVRRGDSVQWVPLSLKK